MEDRDQQRSRTVRRVGGEDGRSGLLSALEWQRDPVALAERFLARGRAGRRGADGLREDAVCAAEREPLEVRIRFE